MRALTSRSTVTPISTKGATRQVALPEEPG
jgi:hypothetical protein